MMLAMSCRTNRVPHVGPKPAAIRDLNVTRNVVAHRQETIAAANRVVRPHGDARVDIVSRQTHLATSLQRLLSNGWIRKVPLC